MYLFFAHDNILSRINKVLTRFFVCKESIVLSRVVTLPLLLSCSSLLSQVETNLVVPYGVLGRTGLDARFVAKAALFCAILLLWTVVFGKILKYLFRLPEIAGQILAGLALGPSLFDVARWPFFSAPMFLYDFDTGVLYGLATSDLCIFFIVLLSSVFTVSYLLWIAGHETDIADILRVGVVATLGGIFGAFLPIIMTVFTLKTFYTSTVNLTQSLGIGLILAATSVSIPVAMLFAKRKMHLESSKATLGAAIIDDILAIVLLSLYFIGLKTGMFGTVTGITLAGAHSVSLSEALAYMLVAFTLIGTIGYYCIPPLIKCLRDPQRAYLMPSMANGVMLLYFSFAELVGGLAGITGAYFAGFFHRLGDKRHRAEKVFSPYVNAVLLPMFLGSIGFGVDVSRLSSTSWKLSGVLLLVAITSKLLACFIATGLSNFFNIGRVRWSFTGAFLFGSSMIARGEVGLVIATVLLSARIISLSLYTMSVVVIITSTIICPVFLAIGFYLIDRRLAGKGAADHLLNIGIFNIIGTTQLFRIIVEQLEKHRRFNTTIALSEGRKVASIEKLNVKIILCPDRGILFEGDPDQVDRIIHDTKDAIMAELDRLPTH